MSSRQLLNWGSNHRSLYERNQILLNNEELSDVKFQFEDNSIIFAHKFILASRSPVFEKMFFWPTKENLIQIKFSTSNIFFKFLQYLYTDNITWMRVCNVGPIMAIAHKYGVNHLEGLCYDFMSGTLSIENACTYLEHCYPFTNGFTEKLFAFIDSKCEEIILQPSFSNLSINPLLNVVKRDTLIVQENHLFKQLLDCFHVAYKNSTPSIENQIIFDQVRFPTMNMFEFRECLRVAPNFFTEKQKLDIVNYIAGSERNFRNESCNFNYPIVKREWKLSKEYLFARQEYNCTEGSKILSMRFRLTNPIEIKEIELFVNENCTYFIEIIDCLSNRVIFARFIPRFDIGTVNCNSVKLLPNVMYLWKTIIYCTCTGIIQVSQGNDKGKISSTILSTGKGRSVIKKIKYVEK